MEEIIVRECTTIEEFDGCVYLQREAFALPDLEISPRRHLIVSRQAGGWTLGAFAGDRMVGFVHHLAAVRANDEIFGYSHVMAVAKDYQNKGVGARLKWAQRERALAENRKLIKWTWDPMLARNAHFNLNRLGAIVDTYADNFYGIDYAPSDVKFGLMDSAESKIGNPAERLLLYCYHYDPASGKYGLAILRVIRLGGVLTLAIMGAMFFVFWRRNKSKQQQEQV